MENLMPLSQMHTENDVVLPGPFTPPDEDTISPPHEPTPVFERPKIPVTNDPGVGGEG